MVPRKSWFSEISDPSSKSWELWDESQNLIFWCFFFFFSFRLRVSNFQQQGLAVLDLFCLYILTKNVLENQFHTGGLLDSIF